MKRTILSLLVAGMFAGVGTSAMAQVNTTEAEDQPAATTQGMTPESDSSTQNPAVSAANRATSGHPALEGVETTSTPDETGASQTAPTHPALEGKGKATSKPDEAAANQTTPTEPALEGNAQSTSKPDTAAALESAKAKCDVLQGDAKSACVTDASMAPSDTLAEADTQSDPIGEANAAAGQESGNDGGNDGMGNASGSPK